MENLLVIVGENMPLTSDETLLATRWPHIVHISSSMQNFISSLPGLPHNRVSFVTNFFNNVDAHYLSSQLLAPLTLNFIFNGFVEQHNIVLISIAAASTLRFPVDECLLQDRSMSLHSFMIFSDTIRANPRYNLYF